MKDKRDDRRWAPQGLSQGVNLLCWRRRGLESEDKNHGPAFWNKGFIRMKSFFVSNIFCITIRFQENANRNLVDYKINEFLEFLNLKSILLSFKFLVSARLMKFNSLCLAVMFFFGRIRNNNKNLMSLLYSISYLSSFS